MVEIDRCGLQILERGECLELLRTTDLGRIGISWRAMPMILPVHFAVEGGRIVVATWDASILAKATLGTVVAFEAEGPPGQQDPAWSVLVNGVADHGEPDRAVPPTRGGDDGPVARRVSITIEHATGRRRVDPPGDVRPWHHTW